MLRLRKSTHLDLKESDVFEYVLWSDVLGQISGTLLGYLWTRQIYTVGEKNRQSK